MIYQAYKSNDAFLQCHADCKPSLNTLKYNKNVTLLFLRKDEYNILVGKYCINIVSQCIEAAFIAAFYIPVHTCSQMLYT